MESLKDKIKGVLASVYIWIRKVVLSLRGKVSKSKASPPEFTSSQDEAMAQEPTLQQTPSTSNSNIKSAISNKKNIKIAAIAIVVVAVLVGSYFYFFQSGTTDQSVGEKKEAAIFDVLETGKVVGTFGVGEKARFGDLQITLHNTRDGSYKTLETGFGGERIYKDYFGAQIEVFNMSHNTNDILFFGMTDDLGNQYERDREIEFYLDDTKDFGIAKEIYPRSIRDGYLLFPAVDKKAKKIEIVVFSDVRKEKIVFEIHREGSTSNVQSQQDNTIPQDTVPQGAVPNSDNETGLPADFSF